jgi:hypothetical protein
MENVMPGLAKALRRKKTSFLKPRRYFENGHVTAVEPCRDEKSGRPGFVFVLDCPLEEVREYRAGLRKASKARIRATDDALALDLFNPRRPIGRLTTSLKSDALSMVAAALDAEEHDEIALYIEWAPVFAGTMPAESPEPFVLPVEIERITREQFHGEPIELGVGTYVAMTINVHDGTVYAHRFATLEQAKEQHERNTEADAPFVGVSFN